jgi:surface antigen
MEACASRPTAGLRRLAFVICLRPQRGAEVEAESAEIGGVGMPSEAGADSEPDDNVATKQRTTRAVEATTQPDDDWKWKEGQNCPFAFKLTPLAAQTHGRVR